MEWEGRVQEVALAASLADTASYGWPDLGQVSAGLPHHGLFAVARGNDACVSRLRRRPVASLSPTLTHAIAVVPKQLGGALRGQKLTVVLLRSCSGRDVCVVVWWCV